MINTRWWPPDSPTRRPSACVDLVQAPGAVAAPVIRRTGRGLSAAGEGGLAGAVLDEGAHAGLLVLGVEELGEQAALQRQALGQWQDEPLVDGLLGGGEGQRRGRGRSLYPWGGGGGGPLRPGGGGGPPRPAGPPR